MIQTPDMLAADMLKAAGLAIAETRKVVQKGAQNIKNEGRRNSIASSGQAAAGAPHAIEYETTIGKTSIEAEIRYGDKNRQGRLGFLLEFGGGRDHSPPHHDLQRALESEEPRFLNALSLMGGTLL